LAAHVGEPPRRPQALHDALSGRGPECRGSDGPGIRRARAAGGGIGRNVGFAVDELLELLAGLEVRHFLGWHVHLVTGLGVAPLSRLALSQPKTAEAPELDFLAPVKRGDD